MLSLLSFHLGVQLDLASAATIAAKLVSSASPLLLVMAISDYQQDGTSGAFGMSYSQDLCTILLLS